MTVATKVRPIIGLEIHVQLRTRTKLFCGCEVQTDAPPNSRVCGICLGHPGTLPVMNRVALESAALAGMALGCEIARFTKWDRKSYYYPDLPKNYQISQYDIPLAAGGTFEFDVDGSPREIRIRRAHLEEDAGKNIHDTPGCTLVDLNRTGTPLLEIVTEPDLASADDTYAFCVELQRLVRHLGVSEADMQKGHMRFEPNVNVAIEHNGREYRTPIAEVKNINSFKFVRQAISYEIERQVAVWEENNDYVIGKASNENRGWDADRGVTEFQRGKEAAHDYRYFPDPDLLPVQLSDETLGSIRAQLVERPVQRRRRFASEYGLSMKDAETIVEHRPTADLFDEVIKLGGPAEIAGKQFVNVWLKHANDRGVAVTELGVEAARIAELAKMTAEGTVNKTAANQLADAMLTRSNCPSALAKELGLVQVQDADATARWVDEAFAANQQAVSDARTNPKKMQAAIGFLRGQVMKLSGGKADPKLVGKLIEERLQQP
ncbi:MAG: Asp-tRNA(Asn)/Glu-tRNA(Gln) amidotransferase subunit GatB [Planctomycetes bacterium]|nr:Asp-tRNA(Asn)/Glu-tRNA(Gln) amidotransferase subunit GatB [Planctomycetota bacterium]MBI3835104.1 Asp-tRNA(Asn)/Glu-tRNA(Gln) amidotransferase subunit GatB [Planctomycetota bacterium]